MWARARVHLFTRSYALPDHYGYEETIFLALVKTNCLLYFHLYFFIVSVSEMSPLPIPSPPPLTPPLTPPLSH